MAKFNAKDVLKAYQKNYKDGAQVMNDDQLQTQRKEKERKAFSSSDVIESYRANHPEGRNVSFYEDHSKMGRGVVEPAKSVEQDHSKFLVDPMQRVAGIVARKQLESGNETVSKLNDMKALSQKAKEKAAEPKQRTTYDAIKDMSLANYTGNGRPVKKPEGKTNTYADMAEGITKYGEDVYNIAKEYVAADKKLIDSVKPGNRELVDPAKQIKERDKIKDQLKEKGLSDKEIKQLTERIKKVEAKIDYDNTEEIIRKGLKDSPADLIGANVLDVATSMAQGPSAALAYAENLASGQWKDPVNTYGDFYALHNFSELTQKATNEKIAEEIEKKGGNDFLQGLGQFGYGATSSTAKAALSMAVGGAVAGAVSSEYNLGEKATKLIANIVTLPTYGTSAFASTLKEDQEKGISAEKAQTHAFVSGLAEMGTEVFSLDKAWDIFSAAKKGKASEVKVLTNMLVQSGIEGSEEGANDIINLIADRLINGGMSDFEQSVRYHQSAGDDEQTARRKAWGEWWLQFGEDVAAGTVSGLAMGGAATVTGQINYHNTARNLKTNAESTQRMLDTAKAIMPEDSTAYKVASQKTADNVTVGELSNVLQSVSEVYQGDSKEVFQEQLEKKGVEKEEAKKQAAVLSEMIKQDSESISEEDSEKNEKFVEEHKEAGEVYGEYLRAVSTINEASETAKEVKAEKIDKAIAPIKNVAVKAADFVEEKINKPEVGKSKYRVANVTVEGTSKLATGLVSVDRVSLEDGTTVDIDSIEMDPKKRAVWNAARSIMEATNSKAMANNVLKFYDEKTSAEEFARVGIAMMNAAEAGQSFERAKESVGVAGETVPEGYLMASWNIGQQEYNERPTENKAAAVPVKVLEKPVETVEDVISKATGIEIVRQDFVLDENNRKVRDAGGSFNAALARIVFTGDNQDAFNHELFGEVTKAFNREGYNKISDYVMDFAFNYAGADQLAKDIQKYVGAYSKVKAEFGIQKAQDEFVNDVIGRVMNSEDGIKALKEYAQKSLSEEDYKTMGQKIAQMFDDLASTIKEYVGANPGYKYAEALMKDAEKAEHLRDMVMKEWSVAIENRKKVVSVAESSQEYSIDPNYAKKISDFWDQLEEDEKNDNDNDYVGRINIGTTSEKLKEIGFIEKTLKLEKKKLKLIFEQHKEIKKDYLLKLPYYLENPFIVANSRTRQEDSIVFITDEIVEVERNGQKVKGLVMFSVVVNENGAELDDFTVTSIYGRDKNSIDPYMNTKSIYYISEDKNKVATTLSAIRVQFPSSTMGYGLIKKIPQQMFGVKPQNGDNAKNNKPKKNGTDEFSLDVSPEVTKDLVAIHNLDERKLMKTLALGGFPMPSIAITKKGMGHSTFGDISVLFGRETIDPKENKSNKAYTADVWTPVFPQVQYEIDGSKLSKLRDELMSGAEKVPEEFRDGVRRFVDKLDYDMDGLGGLEGAVERYLEDADMANYYLAQSGEAVEMKKIETKTVMKDQDIKLAEKIIDQIDDLETLAKMPGREAIKDNQYALRKIYADYLVEIGEGTLSREEAEEVAAALRGLDLMRFIRMANKYKTSGPEEVKTEIDYLGTRNEILEKVDKKEYEAWLRDKIKPIIKDQGIRNGVDIYTNNGRRTFKQTHYPLTAENVVKAMKLGDARNDSTFFNGTKGIRSVATDELKSVDQMHKESGKLQNLTEEEFKDINEKLDKRLADVMNDILASSGTKSDETYGHFQNIENLGNNILEACENPTEENIRRVLNKYKWNPSALQIRELRDIIDDVKNMPVNMFEAKPQRVVDFSEIKNVVIPSDSSRELIEELERNNIPWTMYEAGNEQSRKDVVNEKTSGIEFSLDLFDLEDEVAEILAAEAQEYVSILEEGIQASTDIKPAVIRNVAKKIISDTQTNTKQTDIEDSLKKIFGYLETTGKVDYADVLRTVQEVAKPILENAEKTDPGQQSLYDTFVAELKAQPIKLTTEQLQEVKNSYESPYEYKRAFKGAAKFTNDGISLDSIWTELCDKAYGMLDYGTNPNDQPIALINAVEALRPKPFSLEGKDLEDASMDLALEIFQEFFRQQSLVEASNAQKEASMKAAEDLKNKMTERVKKQKESYNERYNAKLKELEEQKKVNIKRLAEEIESLGEQERQALMDSDLINAAAYKAQQEEYAVRLNKLRQQSSDKLAKVDAEHRFARQQMTSRRKKTEMKARLKKEVESLQNMLAHPGEKASKHIPVDLINATIDMLEAINLDNGKNKAIAERLGKMAKVYEDLKSTPEEAEKIAKEASERAKRIKDKTLAEHMQKIADLYSNLAQGNTENYDERTKADIEELRRMFEGKTYDDLTVQELDRVIEIVQALKIQAKNANNILLSKKYVAAEEAAADAVKEITASRAHDNKVTDLLNRYGSKHLNAYREMRKISGYQDGAIMDLYRGFEEGTLKQMEIERDLTEMFAPVLEGKDNQKQIKAFLKDQVNIGSENDPVMITKAMRMSLILHAQNEANMRHITGSGVRIPNMNYKDMSEAYSKGKIYRFVDYMELMDALKRGDEAKVKELTTSAQTKIENMKEDLSDWEKKFLAIAEKMFHDETGRYINETSMATRGYAIARVNNYFPIRTDSNFTQADWSGLVRDGSLEGMGMLKERKFSKNPILLEDVTNVIQRQIRNVSQYAGMAIPIRNFNLVLNQTATDENGKMSNMKSALGNVWGTNDTTYLQNVIQDLQMGRSEKGGPLMKMRSMFAGATLSLNPSVAIKQAASYPTAAAALGYRPLAMAMKDMTKGFVTKTGIKELEERNPLLWYRNQGNATQDLADAKNSEILKKLPLWMQKATNWTQFMDTGTVRTLEYASMYWVDLNTDLEKGSDAYWDKVSEMFTKVVSETQPNYNKLYQADIIRDPSSLVKQLVMFKTQPMQNFGIIYDAAGELNARTKDYKLDKSEANKKALDKSRKKFAEALSSQIASAMTFSAMTVLANLILHRGYKYRDDEGNWSPLKFVTEWLNGMFGSLAGGMLGGSELYEFIYSKLTKSQYYGVEVSIVSMINNITDDISSLQNSITKLNESETDADIEKYQKMLGKTITKIITDGSEYFGIPINNMKNMVQSAFYYGRDAVESIKEGELTISMDYDVFKTHTKTQYERIFDAMLSGDKEEMDRLIKQLGEKDFKAGVTKLIKEAYLSGKMTEEKAIEMGMKTGKDETDAYGQIKRWEVDSDSTSNYASVHAKVDAAIKDPSGANIAAVQKEVKAMIDHGFKKNGVANSLKGKYGETYADLKEKKKAADMNAVLMKALMAAGFTESEAKDKLSKW